MKGRILGWTGTEGAISADDGRRYRFTPDDWRGERPPATSMAVDFEADASGVARDIYPAMGGAGLAVPGFSSSLPPLAGADIKALFTRSLAAPLALVVLAACFLPAITSPQEDVSLIGLGGALNKIVMPTGLVADFLGGAGNTDLGLVKTLAMLRFAVPLAALWLLWSAWTGKSESRPMLIAGAAALGGAGLVFMMQGAVVDAAPELLRPQIRAAMAIGMGVWLLILSGGALIAAGLGFIRNPLGRA
jgi:hypothetical protein